MEQPQPQINIKKLEELLRTINSAETKSELNQRYPDDKLLNLYNAWNSLEEHDKKQLEVDKYSPISEAPTRVLLSPNSTTYRDISTNPNTQIIFAQDHLVKLMRFTPYQESVVRTMKLRAVADQSVDDQAVADQAVVPLIRSPSVNEIIDVGDLLIEEANDLLPLHIQRDTNFLKINAEIITKFIILIINFMLLIFCCMLTLSRLLSREDVESSPDVKQKIFLLKKALMQYYTNFFRLIASVFGFSNFVSGAKKLSWPETSVIIAIFIGIHIVLSYIDPNNYVMSAVMFPISFPIYCADFALSKGLSKAGIYLTNMFWSRIDLIMGKIQIVGDKIIGKATHLMLSWVKDNVISVLKSDIIKWLSTDGAQQVQDAVQGAVQGEFQVALPQIQHAVQDAVQGEFQVALPQIQGAIQEVSQSYLLELQLLIEQSSASCQLLTQHQADMLSRISDDPTTLEQFTKSLSWWGNLVQENAIKALIQGILAVRGNPQIGYRGGRKTRKYRKNYKNKTKIYRKKQTHKRYRKKTKKGKKSNKY
jgi:hypothetical protein